MLKPHELEMLRTVAKGVAAEFGSGCEVVVHEISPQAAEHSLVAIENGQVTGRKPGDGPSQVVLEQLKKAGSDPTVDRLSYLTRTPGGKLLKSSTVFLRGEDGKVCAIFGINFDISALALAEGVLSELTSPEEKGQTEPTLLRREGKPVSRMNKDDKITAIRFLADSGAMLITKSGDKIAKFFGISKYTLYSYLDTKQEDKKHD